MEVRRQAERSGEILAQLEVMSAYGLHHELFSRQDGVTLPRAIMAAQTSSFRRRDSPPLRQMVAITALCSWGRFPMALS